MATIRNLLIRISVSENTSKGVRRVTGELQKTNREVDRANKSSNRFSSTLSKLGRTSLGGLTSGLAAITKFTAAAGKGLFLVASAASALNTAVQAGAALAPLAGGLLLIPGAALAAGAAIGTLHLAMSGVGDAFKEALAGGPKDPKKFAASLKNLAPAARSVAVELHKLRPEFDYIKNSAQQQLFKPLQGQLTAVARTLKGPVASGVATVAKQFGLAGRQVALFTRDSTTVAVIRVTFLDVAQAIHQVLPALQPLLVGFRDLAALGTSFLPGVATSVGQIATRFGQWLQQLIATGKAQQWIQNFFATLKQIGSVVGNVGGILKSVFSAASAAGSGFIGVIGAALARLNAFLKTAAGQQALQSIFQGLAAIGQTLGPVIAALVTQLGVLAKPIGDMAKLIGPILATAINALGPAIAALAPGVTALIQGFGGAIQALAPALAPLGNALAQIGVAIGPILPLVGRLVGQLVTALAPILGKLFIALGPLIGAIVKLASAFAPLIPPLAQIIVQLVQGLVPALTPIIAIVGRIAGIIGQFLISAFQQLTPVINALLPILDQVATNIGTALVTMLQALAPALLDVLKAILPLVPSLVQLLVPMTRLLVVLTPIIALLIKLVAVILRNVLPIIVYLINLILKLVIAIENGLVSALGWLVRNLPKIGSTVLNAFAGAGKWLYNVGKNIIIGLWNGIVSVSSWLYHRLVDLIKAIIPAPIRWALGIHSPSKVMAELGRFAGLGLAIGLEGTAPHVRRAAGTLATAAVPATAGFSIAPAGVTAARSARSGSGGGIDPRALAQAVKQALDGVGVHMDGQPVGQIVSRHLGRSTDQRRRTG